jgi:hypothetical protein
VTPPLTTHQELVLVERAFALARAEKSRMVRDQEGNHVVRIETKAGRRVGLDSFRAHLGDAVVALGNAIAGRERVATREGGSRIAAAHR